MRVSKHTCCVLVLPNGSLSHLFVHMQCPSPVHTSAVSSATMCWRGHTCSHIPAVSQHHATDTPVLISIVSQPCHLVAQAYTFACLPLSELSCGGVVWVYLFTRWRYLQCHGAYAGLFLHPCPAPPRGGVGIPVHMPALNHSSNIWPCRYTCLHFWCPSASNSSKGTSERSCTAKHLCGHTHSRLLCPVLQRT